MEKFLFNTAMVFLFIAGACYMAGAVISIVGLMS